MTHRIVLFLCTGNYYRSRTAELLFNDAATKMGLQWRADSTGLALERGNANVGPIAPSVLNHLKTAGISATESCARMPKTTGDAELKQAEWVVALLESEHRPLLMERHTGWEDRVEYWHIEDRDGVLPDISEEVMDLISRLMRGGVKRKIGPLAKQTITQAKAAPAKKLGTAKVGRETAGRRGKGVTTIFELNLDENGLKELATQLKNACGTGGTAKDGRIEIQGDHREKITAELEKLGYKVKRVGG